MDAVAGAIADPVRREILELLRHSRRTAGDIASHFSITRPAISRHLRVLRESGLVHDELVGRQRFYVLHPGELAELATWIARFDTSAEWMQRLDALETEVYRTRREHRAGPTDQQTQKEQTA
ncbi:ArsR family transcriptional regulator [Rhodococcus sp. ABRD24]|uniref:metalloregulator ArsR/SmtB family transcription factor n=1 Tax=Rhodococcus sp. ABRD24 TaxID=2507582 RepID=UPI0010391489|nr:metalloregulator ArsR/SmtB family transcription factor [Rhodococcus sp. ABRD24]QBJ94653.1 ArsR family transcriptional regulator [Rhodococcus sp. ABRD24]